MFQNHMVSGFIDGRHFDAFFLLETKWAINKHIEFLVCWFAQIQSKMQKIVCCFFHYQPCNIFKVGRTGALLHQPNNALRDGLASEITWNNASKLTTDCREPSKKLSTMWWRLCGLFGLNMLLMLNKIKQHMLNFGVYIWKMTSGTNLKWSSSFKIMICWFRQMPSRFYFFLKHTLVTTIQ